ncbi:MAG: hypothetical protein ACRCZF_19700, partial [Gemmataceae bacterium]
MDSVTEAPRINWVRRHGLEATRTQWLQRGVLAGWLGGLVALTFAAESWSLGEILIAYMGWFALLLVGAWGTVRDLFGPVFFYEVVRLGRRRLTFGLRCFYVCCISL